MLKVKIKKKKKTKSKRPEGWNQEKKIISMKPVYNLT
jgi:hypothetical protein